MPHPDRLLATRGTVGFLAEELSSALGRVALGARRADALVLVRCRDGAASLTRLHAVASTNSPALNPPLLARTRLICRADAPALFALPGTVPGLRDVRGEITLRFERAGRRVRVQALHGSKLLFSHEVNDARIENAKAVESGTPSGGERYPAILLASLLRRACEPLSAVDLRQPAHAFVQIGPLGPLTAIRANDEHGGSLLVVEAFHGLTVAVPTVHVDRVCAFLMPLPWVSVHSDNGVCVIANDDAGTSLAWRAAPGARLFIPRFAESAHTLTIDRAELVAALGRLGPLLRALAGRMRLAYDAARQELRLADPASGAAETVAVTAPASSQSFESFVQLDRLHRIVRGRSPVIVRRIMPGRVLWTSESSLLNASGRRLERARKDSVALVTHRFAATMI